MRFHIEPATDKYHKWVGVFTDPATKEEKRVSFGAKGYEDLTIHRDRRRAKLYIARHRSNENWMDPYSKGALSRFILWETPDLQTNVRRFKQRFGLE